MNDARANMTSENEEWIEPRRRKRSKKGQGGPKEVPSTPGSQFVNRASTTPGKGRSGSVGRVRNPPRTAAVMITGRKENFSNAAALKKAQDEISLEQLKIDRTKIRRAANGSMLIEVRGPDGQTKAKALREKLSEVLKDETDITRPVTRREIRLVGLDDSTSIKDVRDTVVKQGGCLEG